MQTYRWLAPGNYNIHVTETAEMAELMLGANKPGPDEVAYHSRDLPFAVTEHSPTSIDLSEVQLVRVDK